MDHEVAARDANRVPVEIGIDRWGRIRQRRYSRLGGAYSRVEPNEHYKAYKLVIPGNTAWDSAIHVDVGSDLMEKYGTSERIPGVAGFIISDSDIQLRFNGLGEDEIFVDVGTWGSVFELAVGDLGIYDIYIANYLPSGAAPDANVFIFISG